VYLRRTMMLLTCTYAMHRCRVHVPTPCSDVACVHTPCNDVTHCTYAMQCCCLCMQGHTALSLASMAGHTQVAKLLLLHGADVRAKDEDVSIFCLDGDPPLVVSSCEHKKPMRTLDH